MVHEAFSRTFILEDTQGQSHSISFSYDVAPDFQSNVCGYVVRVTNFAIAEPTTLPVHTERGYYTNGGWFSNYTEDELSAVIDP